MNIFEAKRELNDFLREHPELKADQAAIEELLKGAGSQHNRNVVLQQLMAQNISKLGKLTWEALNIMGKK